MASSSEDRPPNIHPSALSPLEYPLFLKWAKQIEKSPSGVQGLLDEQHALAWLRKECAVGRVEEVKILSLFDRYPLGLEQGHFFALLRLVAWAQQGRSPTNSLVFTQTTPPTTGLKEGTPYPLLSSLSIAAGQPTRPPPQHPSTLLSSDHAAPSSSRLESEATAKSNTPSSKVPPPLASTSQQQEQLLPALVPSIPSSLQQSGPSRSVSMSIVPPPVPPESSKPSKSPVSANPFKTPQQSGRSVSLATPATAVETPLHHSLDQLPGSQKQVKPKIVRPTPVVAMAGSPNPVSTATDPSRMAGLSGISSRSVKSIDEPSSPPLPPRPAGTEKPPPPLPPRAHISPLIQAGLQASMQVRKQKDALPPKTFTVLQSSSSRAKAPVAEPRLLTGESAPAGLAIDMLPPPMHHAKRKVSGAHEHKRTISEMTGGNAMQRGFSDEADPAPQRAVGGSATVIAAPKPSRPGHSRHRVRRDDASTSGGAPTDVAAPKAQYANGAGSMRTKPTLPSWLREQEELQRSALVDGRPLSPPLGEEEDRRRRSSFAVKVERSRREPTVLDEEFDIYPAELNDQASRAASIDRPHNPFIHRSSQAEAEKLRIPSTLRNTGGRDRDRDHGSTGSRSPEAHKGRSRGPHHKGPPPPPPSHGPLKKKSDVMPVSLESGTYAGFRYPVSSTLRLMPAFGKADAVGSTPQSSDVGKRSQFSAMRRHSGALSLSSSSGVGPLSPQGDEDSGETSINSTNPTTSASVQGLASDLERRLSSRSNNGSAATRGNSLRGKVSDLLKLQDAPPKGQRPLDDLKRDAMRLAERKGWINRRGESDGLLADEDEDEVDNRTRDGNSVERDQAWDDAPTPDDGTTTADTADTSAGTTEGDSTQRDATPQPAHRSTSPSSLRRSATMSAAPVARRASGYVARRASRIEERHQEEVSSDPFQSGSSTRHAGSGPPVPPARRSMSSSGGSSSNTATPLGRAASFSVRGKVSPFSTSSRNGGATWSSNQGEDDERRSSFRSGEQTRLSAIAGGEGWTDAVEDQEEEEEERRGDEGWKQLT